MGVTELASEGAIVEIRILAKRSNPYQATATDKLTMPPNLAVARTADTGNQPLSRALAKIGKFIAKYK